MCDVADSIWERDDLSDVPVDQVMTAIEQLLDDDFGLDSVEVGDR